MIHHTQLTERTQLSRFFVYEEYGARYESMLREMTNTSKTIPHWEAYERGIEALANTLAPTSGSDGTNKKGLTFADLLIKVLPHPSTTVH